MTNAEKPVVHDGDSNIVDSVITHPAFGMVSVSRRHTNKGTLFASDLNHHELIVVSVSQGQTAEHEGSIRHRKEPRATPLIEFTLSPAQWAAMITSFGMGDGVPCTLNIVREGKPVRVPDILPIESTRERFDRQIEENARRQIEKMQEVLAELGELVAKGKAGKKELAELYRSMSIGLGNLPVNLAFTSTLLQEQMDDIVASGKAELEAVALGVAQRMGVKEISRLAALEDKSGEDE